MASEIRKYQIDLTNKELIQEIEIPILGKIVYVGEYPNGNAYIWVEVDQLDEPNPHDINTPKRRFQVVKTGEPLLANSKVVGTIISSKLGGVYHVIELSNRYSWSNDEASAE